MPDTAWPISRHPPGSSQAVSSSPVSMSSKADFDTSSVDRLRSPSWSTPAALTARLFPRRSPPRLLTAAARGGLRPPPAGRPRRTTSPERPAPPSPMQHRINQSDLLHRFLLVAFVAHARRLLRHGWSSPSNGAARCRGSSGSTLRSARSWLPEPLGNQQSRRRQRQRCCDGSYASAGSGGGG